MQRVLSFFLTEERVPKMMGEPLVKIFTLHTLSLSPYMVAGILPIVISTLSDFLLNITNGGRQKPADK